MNEELTVWFPPEIKPARRGWYQRDYLGGPAHSFWDGRAWSMGCFSLNDRKFVRREISLSQYLRWRGLAKQPK